MVPLTCSHRCRSKYTQVTHSLYFGHRAGFYPLGKAVENGYIESFNGRLRDELLDTEIFSTLAEAK